MIVTKMDIYLRDGLPSSLRCRCNVSRSSFSLSYLLLFWKRNNIFALVASIKLGSFLWNLLTDGISVPASLAYFEQFPVGNNCQ